MIDNIFNKNGNTHYINKYIKFIHKFNGTGNIKHHILPKANDMFPEFANLTKNKWNICLLNERAHFIAHMILAKAFPASQSCTYSAYRMSCKYSINSRLYQQLKINFRNNARTRTLNQHANMTPQQKKDRCSKISQRNRGFVQSVDVDGSIKKVTREYFYQNNLKGHTTGKVTVKDKNGDIFSISKQELINNPKDFVGINKGIVWKTETKKLWSQQRKGKLKTEEHKNNLRKPKTKVTCNVCGQLISSNKIRMHNEKFHCT